MLKSTMFVVLATAAMLLFIGCGTDKKQLESAHSLYNSSKYEEAEKVCEQILSTSKDNTYKQQAQALLDSVRLKSAFSLYGSSQYREAEKVCEQMLSTSKDSKYKLQARALLDSVRLKFAHSLYSRSQYGEAEKVCEQMLGTSKDNKYQLRVKALLDSVRSDSALGEMMTMINSEKMEEAIAFASQCIKEHPQDPRFYYSRGYSYLLKKRYKESSRDISKCVRIAPEYSDGYYGMALIYEKKSQFSLAEKKYDKALELVSNKERKAVYYCGLSLLCSQMHKCNKAIDAARKGIELDTIGDFYYPLGMAYLCANKTSTAVKTFLTGLNDHEFKQVLFKHLIHYKLAMLSFNKRDYRSAKKYIEAALELAPDNSTYLKLYRKIKARLK